ncbi:phosphatidate cytidylyltransferase [Blastopirellula retiformator]|uniref:Phosphatidate cytidylyltransferase n=1 Tax=Blastopirellula retiformator TaxID=2527970 RepID=A0A5C5UV56_9BACT|nr:phosphatidate cytidylyltransferase [Blastopirellula retiformator]TWT29453.1 Phosphatidate cytidylyltransferase [Blastopirellula retiformator]
MLGWRLIGAAAIIIPVITLCWLDFSWNFDRPGIWLLPLAVMIAVFAAEEVLGLLRAKQLRPAGWACHVGTLLVLGTAAMSIWWPFETPPTSMQSKWILFSLAAGMVLSLVSEMRRYEKPGWAIVHVGLTIFTIAYVGGLMSFVIRLRLVHSELPDGNAWGMIALLSMIVATKMSDAGAYFTGRLFGRTKLAPNLSPGKTVEGALGGLVFAVFGAWVIFALVAPQLTTSEPPAFWRLCLYAICVAIAGMVGDLAESLFKRDMESKDSSTWLIGLGGVLDVLDSLLVAAPMALFFWEIGLVGPQ